jgi:hypothetical protein
LSMLNGLLELPAVDGSPALRGIKAWPSERHVEQYSYPQCPQTWARRMSGTKGF